MFAIRLGKNHPSYPRFGMVQVSTKSVSQTTIPKWVEEV